MYRSGAILKITMTNFVTYTYVEFFPGPNLNLVLGPNGSGKSTIVAAIILGLGGNPKVIGRGTKVSEYVKHGFSNARVDILLQGPDEEDTFTVTREFDLNEKNTWKLNGKSTTQKEVCSFLNQLNIQVDNLCQFLPQDRVQNFTKMNKQELLRQTKTALCRDDLLQKQQNLIKKHDRHKALALELDKQVKKLEDCRNMNARLEGKVKSFNKKKEYLRHVRNIERKMSWIEYESLAARREEIKEDKAQATEIYERRLNELKPIEKSISNAQRNVAVLRTHGTKIENLIKSTESKINTHLGKVTHLKETISEILSGMQTKMDEIEQREFEINSSIMKLDQLRSDEQEIINKYGNEAAVQEKENRFFQQIKEISSMVAQIEQIKFNTNNAISEKSYEIRGSENELRRIENIKQRRFDWLRKADPDAYSATLWLRENKNRFSGEIYEPIVTELNVINQEDAIYIENMISINDKIAFVCTSKDDMNLFIRIMRDQQHLKVNVIHSGEEHPPFQSYQPAIPIEQLKKYGFYAYAHSLFTGPESIMKYLCRTNNIHCVPIGNKTTNRCFEDVPPKIRNFFSDEYRFSTNYSKYTGEKSTSQSQIQSDGSLSMSVDAVQLNHVKDKIQEANRECERQREEIQVLDQKTIQLNERSSKLTGELRTLKSSQQQIKIIRSRIQVMDDKLESLRRQTDTKEMIKQKAHKEIENVNEQILAVQEQIKEDFTCCSNHVTQAHLNVIKVNVCDKEITFLKNKAIEAQQHHSEAEETLKHIKDEYKNITARAKTALESAKKLSNGCTPNDDAFEEFRKTYDDMGDDLEALMVEKNDVLTKIGCLHAAGNDEMKEYEGRVKAINTLETSIEEINCELNEIITNMDRLKEEYMQPLGELVDKISEKFSAAFESMGYSGEVLIDTGINERDYAQYGLSIMVTYRNGQRLQELNSTTQSGGEKAVATATYLLALQEHTPVPFRCVDEINQGMDSINERKILELLMDSTSQPNTSQYFLITPKLLQNLKFVPTMKIHFVHNGPFVISQQQWNAAQTY